MKAFLAILGGLLVGGLLTASSALAQGQLTDSYVRISKTTEYVSYQPIRCDNSAAIAGADSPTSGETCVSGDYSKPYDARGYKNLLVQYWEYGGGSGQVFVWSCNQAVGAPGTFGGVGSEPPANAPSAADPEPLCVELAAGAGVADFDGLTTGTVMLNLSNQVLNWIVIEIQDCTGDCDGTVMVGLGR